MKYYVIKLSTCHSGTPSEQSAPVLKFFFNLMKCMQKNSNWPYFVRKPGEMKAKMREKNRMFF
jgi:hypothetical protein